MTQMLDMEKVITSVQGLGFERIEHLPGSTFRDNSTVIIIPTRGMIHHKVVVAWQGMIAPMNQKRAILFASGHEVGQAYDEMVQFVMNHKDLGKYKYVLSLEDDNLPQPDAHIKLLETIDWGGYDAVSGIYFTKGPVNMPMAYGDPDEYRKTGILGFQPRNIAQALQAGNVMEVNGIACGCALWRMDMFQNMKPPWFETICEWTPEKGPAVGTQDLIFCGKAKKVGKRFAVDLRVRVGHLDIETGTIY